MRDMWVFTGGCHYTLECTRYASQCGSCPCLHSGIKYDLSSILQFIKYKLISPKKNIVFVGISEWLTETAKKSKILSGHDISTISNNPI